MNVLVTGGTGFIGSNLLQGLLRQKHNVFAVDIDRNNDRNIEGIENEIDVFYGDISNYNFLNDIFTDRDIDAVIHLATLYNPSHNENDIKPMIETNVLGINNLLEISSKNKVKKFINTGSGVEYKLKDMPLKETDELEPWNLYGETKLMAERISDYYCRTYNLNAITLRLFAPYGPKDNINKFIPFIITNGIKNLDVDVTKCEQMWDYTYVEDIVNGYLKALEFDPEGHEVFNIGTGDERSSREIIEVIMKQLDSSSKVNYGAKEYRENDIFYYIADISKAKEKLKWNPEHSIEEGIIKTIEYFKKELIRQE